MPTGDELSDNSKPTSMPDLVGAATGRVEQVLKAAEQGAEGILEDARVQARRYVSEARGRIEDVSQERIQRITELTDTLVAQGDSLKEQAEALRRQSEGLTQAITQATRALEQEIGAVEVPQATSSARESRRREAETQQSRPASPQTSDETSEERQGFFHRLLRVEETTGGARTGVESGDEPDQSSDGSERMKGDSRGISVVATQLRQAGLSREEVERKLSEDFGVTDVAAELDRRRRGRESQLDDDRGTATR